MLSKTQKFGFFGIIVIIIFIIILLMPKTKTFSEPNTLTISNDFFELLEDGDIICRLGDRFWSNLFKDVSETDKRFSHMGIVYKSDTELKIINSEGDTGHGMDFVNMVELADFLRVARTVGVYRLQSENRVKLSQIALEYLNTPFDWQFDMSNADKLYCTELLYVVLKRIGLDLDTVFVKELSRDIIPLDSVSNSKLFLEIIFLK